MHENYKCFILNSIYKPEDFNNCFITECETLWDALYYIVGVIHSQQMRHCLVCVVGYRVVKVRLHQITVHLTFILQALLVIWIFCHAQKKSDFDLEIEYGRQGHLIQPRVSHEHSSFTVLQLQGEYNYRWLVLSIWHAFVSSNIIIIY